MTTHKTNSVSDTRAGRSNETADKANTQKCFIVHVRQQLIAWDDVTVEATDQHEAEQRAVDAFEFDWDKCIEEETVTTVIAVDGQPVQRESND